MSGPAGWRLDRRIGAAVLVALALQAAGALVWTGRASARIDDMDRRLEAQAPLAERLARLEEQAIVAKAALDRIEQKIDRREDPQ